MTQTRRLAAILADAAGYPRQIGVAQKGTLTTLARFVPFATR
jgi:hypothetical protein